MTNGAAVLMITAYVYASLILAAQLPVYLFASPQRLGVSPAMALHKLLVALTVLLPLALGIRSWRDELSASAGLVPDGGAMPGLSNMEPVANAGDPRALTPAMAGTADQAQNATTWESADQLQSINDVAYFVGDFLFWCVIAGGLVFLLRYLRQLFHVRRILRAAECIEVRDGIEIYRSPEVIAPFSIGCMVPRVLLPFWLDCAAREPVIRHELNHFKCRHHWWALGEALVAHVFWFNPVLHVLRRRGTYLRELESDQRTAREMDPFVYARALIASAEHVLTRRCPVIGGHAWIERNPLKDRIDLILGKPKSVRRWASWAIVLTVLSGAAAGAIVVGNVNDRFLQEEILETVNREYAQTLSTEPVVEIGLVPAAFRRALLLYYDNEFYRHDGVMLFRGSTITQQLARTFLRIRGYTVDRKLRELKVTRVLEDNFTKDQILEMHLNRVFWGNRAYGLAAAAETYFAKPYSELTRDESAMLIPFLDAPTAYNMRANAEFASQRQQQLLARMDALAVD